MRLNFFAILKNKTKKPTKTTKSKQSKDKTCKPNIPHVDGRALSLSVSLTDIVSDQCLYILIHQGPLSPITSRCRTAPGSLFHSMSQY